MPWFDHNNRINSNCESNVTIWGTKSFLSIKKWFWSFFSVKSIVILIKVGVTFFVHLILGWRNGIRPRFSAKKSWHLRFPFAAKARLNFKALEEYWGFVLPLNFATQLCKRQHNNPPQNSLFSLYSAFNSKRKYSMPWMNFILPFTLSVLILCMLNNNTPMLT